VIAFMTGLFQQEEEIQKLNKIFEFMDEDKDGYISMSELEKCTEHVE
jgi:Ca2+-binding EF-hand superfamily protein